MNTVKRYCSAIPPLGNLSRMNPAQRKEWDSFDAKLTPEDIYEIQVMDADCNDCKHFQRGVMRKGLGIACFEGHCQKFYKSTLAWPMQYTGHACFEHRKAA